MTPEELASRPRTADEQTPLDDFAKVHGQDDIDKWGELPSGGCAAGAGAM